MQRQRQRGNGFRLPVEAAVADHRALLPVQIEHRRERQIDAAGGQLAGEHPADLFGGGFGGFAPLFVPHFAQRGHGRQAGEAVDKALDAAAFVIDGDNQLGRAQRFDVGGERFELLDVLEVAAKQNHAADGGIEQALALLVAQSEGGNVGHYRAARKMGCSHGRWVLAKVGGNGFQAA